MDPPAAIPSALAEATDATPFFSLEGQTLEAKIVDAVAAEDEVVAKAVEIAAGLASKAHPAMTRLKAGMYPHVLEALAVPMSEIEGV